MNHRYIFLLLVVFSAGCNDRKKDQATTTAIERSVAVPSFNADSSLYFVQKQVDFGPRTPNTAAHRRAGDFFVHKLRSFGASVREQSFSVKAYDGQMLNLRNIIASYNPDEKKRILLAAHWDTRPFADKDTTRANAKFDGANDGASGVGVLLEVARAIHTGNKPDVGVDIILFDGEDWGEPDGLEDEVPLPENLKSWWCLGSQYWSKNKHQPNYSAYYGILLDMVGASGAQFHREGYSMEFAPGIVDKVWSRAEKLGYSHFFVRQNQEPIIDDHYFINTDARIPTIDIVHFQPGVGFFGEFHHTTMDDMDIISKETLKAVGETVLSVVYYEE